MFSIMIPIAIRIARQTQFNNTTKIYYTKNLLKFRATCVTGLTLFNYMENFL